MKDENKTKKQLIKELKKLRRQNKLNKEVESDRKKAEEELRESKKRFEDIAISSGDWIWEVDAGGKYTFASGREEQILGYTSEELMGKTPFELMPEKEAKRVGKIFEKIAAGKKPIVDLENRNLSKKGELVYLLTNGVPIIDSNGELAGYRGVNKDITEQKKAEEEIMIRNQVAKIFLIVSDEEMYGDVLGVILKALDSKYGVFGYINEKGDLVVPTMTRKVWDQCKVKEKDIVFPKKTWGNSSWPRAIREKKPNYSNKKSKLFPKGHVSINRHLSTPIVHRGNVIGIFQVANKASDYNKQDLQLLQHIADFIAPALNARLQKERQEKARKKVEEELFDKNKELGQVLYATSHDLRSPLVNVQGFNQELQASIQELNSILKNQEVPKAVRKKIKPIIEEDIPESLKYILTGTSKMDRILSGLLTLARLGRQKMTIKKLDMNKVMKDVIFTYKYKIKKKNIKLELSQLPACKGDELQVNQLFSNLLGNSIKFMDSDRAGVIKISGKKKKDQVLYCVEDNGIGIPLGHQNKIFELFHQLDPKTPGTGLGLSIIAQILEKHNGNIQIDSQQGKGTRITVSLPVEYKGGSE
ncbi:MAG: ATP-binding protein [Acidobacteriota bacterium]